MTDRPETERVDALARALTEASPRRPGIHAEAAAILAALTGLAWSVEPRPTYQPHPDANHEFRNVCQRCGENGYLNVAIVTDLEVVRIEPRAALRGGPDATD